MQAALAEVIHKHSNVNGGDTIAAELAKKFKNDPEVLTHIAKAYMQNRTTDKARKYLDKAIKIKPDGYSPALVVKADIFKEESQIDSAALYYEKAVAADSTNADAYVGYAMMYAKYAGGIDKSIAMLEKARGRVPYFNVDAAIADCYSESGDSKDAIEAIEKMDWNLLDVSQMEQFCVNLWINGENRIAGSFEKGVEASNYCVQRWPDVHEFKKMQLWHKAQTGLYTEAINDGMEYRRLVPPEQDLMQSVTLFSLGISYLGNNNLQEALECFDSLGVLDNSKDRYVSSTKKQRVSSINTIADRMIENGQYDTALQYYKAVIEHYPGENTDLEYVLIMQTYSRMLQKALESEKEKITQILFSNYTDFENKYTESSYIDLVYFWHANLRLNLYQTEASEIPLTKKCYENCYKYYIKNNSTRKPQAVGSCLMISKFELFEGNIEEARKWVDAGLELDPLDQELLDQDAKVALTEQNQPKKKKKR